MANHLNSPMPAWPDSDSDQEDLKNIATVNWRRLPQLYLRADGTTVVGYEGRSFYSFIQARMRDLSEDLVHGVSV
jgi:hypothetical protein